MRIKILQYLILSCLAISVTFITGVSAQSVIISGQIFDENKHIPLAFANVEISNKETKLVKSLATDTEGRFKCTIALITDPIIKISFIGYETKEIYPVLNYQQKEFALPLIYLSVQKKYLQEVIVNGHKTNTSTLQIDKQIIDARKFQTATNGTGLDLLKKIPSVIINNEGEMALRGNTGLTILVNGIPSNRTAADILSQLPANNIENIEIITSPSAQYEANGKGGIINIITKKSISSGWSISSSGMFGGLDPLRFAGDLQINYNAKKWSYFASADYRRYDIMGHRVGIVRSIVNDTLTYLPSDGVRDYRDHQYSLKTGFSYTPSTQNSFNILYYYGFKESDRTANLHYQQYSEYPSSLLFDQPLTSPEKLFFNKNLFVRTGEFSTISADFTHQLTNKSKITLAGIYEYSVLGGPLDNIDLSEGKIIPYTIEHSDERSPLHGIRLQGDYSYQVTDELKFESGYQLRILNEQGFFNYYRKDSSTGFIVTFPADFNNQLELKQQIHAGYFQLSGTKNKFSYNAGIRIENMHRTLSDDFTVVPYLLDKFIAFPTLQLLWKKESQQQLKLSYSKRVDWPSAKLLSPFKNHRHEETIEIGDPNLKPEIADIAEASYSKDWRHIRFSSTLYYNYVKDKVFRINAIYDPTILLRTYTNSGNASSTGIELNSDIAYLKHLSFYISGNVYYYAINNRAANEKTSSINYNTYFNATVDLSSKLKFQWDLSYQSATVTSQGHDSQIFNSNAGFKYTTGEKKNVFIGLQLNNIFDSNNQWITTQTSSFYSSTDYIKHERVLQFSVSVKLNENNIKKVKVIKTEYGEKEF